MGLREQLVDLSHEFGTTDYVQGGGGNSSVKNENTLWVKPSGTTLIGLEPDQLLELDRERVSAIYDFIPPDDVKEREARVTEMLAATRRDPNDPRRPSVESPLHNSFRATFVVHTHPQFVGGLVASRRAQGDTARLFPDHLYLPATDPGYKLCMQISEALRAMQTEQGKEPQAVFMENHGLVVAGNTPEEVRAVTRHIMETLGREYERAGIATTLTVGPPPASGHVADVTAMVQRVCGGEHTAHAVADGHFAVPVGPLTPDHIVYMKSYPFVGALTEAALNEFVQANGYTPRVVVTDQAVVGFGNTPKSAQLAMDLAKDGAVIEQLSEAFGGVQYMGHDARRFIEEWEAESYRQNVAAK